MLPDVPHPQTFHGMRALSLPITISSPYPLSLNSPSSLSSLTSAEHTTPPPGGAFTQSRAEISEKDEVENQHECGKNWGGIIEAKLSAHRQPSALLQVTGLATAREGGIARVLEVDLRRSSRHRKGSRTCVCAKCEQVRGTEFSCRWEHITSMAWGICLSFCRTG